MISKQWSFDVSVFIDKSFIVSTWLFFVLLRVGSRRMKTKSDWLILILPVLAKSFFLEWVRDEVCKEEAKEKANRKKKERKGASKKLNKNFFLVKFVLTETQLIHRSDVICLPSFFFSPTFIFLLLLPSRWMTFLFDTEDKRRTSNVQFLLFIWY